MKTKELYDLKHSLVGKLLEKTVYPWEAIDRLGDMINEIGKDLPKDYEQIYEGVFVHKSAKISDSAEILGPCVIGKESELRSGAFIRARVIIGENCVVGNSTELKNAVLFDNVAVPHFNYVGDSILGYGAHLGAGVILSNVKSDKSLVNVELSDGTLRCTGLKKCGSFVGDLVEIGCNCVLNPGCIIGKYTTVYPMNSVRGFVGQGLIVKSEDRVVVKK